MDELEKLKEKERELWAGGMNKETKIFYLCDRKACQLCSGENCDHTKNIEHARNFKNKHGIYVENDNRDKEDELEKALRELNFYSHVQAHRKFGTVTSNGYYAVVSSEALEKNITSVLFYAAKKDILVPQKQKNGLMRLVRIKKGKLYKWDRIVDKGYILLAADIKQKGNIRKYHDVIKLKKRDLDKYFIKKQCC